MPVEGQGRWGRGVTHPRCGAASREEGVHPTQAQKDSGMTSCWGQFKNCFFYKLMVARWGKWGMGKSGFGISREKLVYIK